MAYIKNEETYYDILKVEKKATVAEVVAAYHTAKNAFSKDSVATYSLFNSDEAQAVLSKLEEAYLTLSNFEKRADYDRILTLKAQNLEVPVFSELELKQKAKLLPNDLAGGTSNIMMTLESKPAEPKAPQEPPTVVESLNGTSLKEFREKRTLSLEDVSRITKIPVKSLKALENDQFAQLPARVYVQGFVKNLATLYRLESNSAVKAYLSYLENLQPAPQKS
jgi:curved DNA-binding protein CbpA